MKRITTLTAAFVIMAAMTASANISLHNSMYDVRSYTMGGEKINNIIKDQGNIWLYPQTIAMYADQAEGTWDDNLSNEFARLGVNFQFGSNNPFTLGVYIDQTGGTPFNHYSAYNFTSPGWSRRPFSSRSLPNNHTLNIFYGRQMGGNPFGVHVQAFNSKGEYPNTTAPDQVSLTALATTFGLTNGGGNMDLAASIFFSTFTDETNGVANTEADGSLGLDVRFRRWSVQSSKITWVWHGSVGYGKTGIKYTTGTTTTTEEFKHTMFDLGAGLNYTPSSKVLVVMDVGLEYSKDDYTLDNGTTTSENNNKNLTIPPYYALGVDAEVLSWLDLRMGASNHRSNNKNEWTPGSGETKINQNMVDTYVGFGFHWGDLTVDTYVNPNFFTEGPYFISGDDTNDIFAYLNATLHFGN